MNIFFSELRHFLNKYFKKKEKYQIIIFNVDKNKWNVYCKGMEENLHLTIDDIQNGKLKEELNKFKNIIMDIKRDKENN